MRYAPLLGRYIMTDDSSTKVLDLSKWLPDYETQPRNVSGSLFDTQVSVNTIELNRMRWIAETVARLLRARSVASGQR
ncbi:hypothetical protein Pla100_23290 [Neorhodopirellula pilleata]|uniref:Uncharacterized protein n=1 Tax=Neorhodopirellula pilleata TaxID=2714738 RepID=A0A5C6AC58_9BACT|nr:hypothetical protein Pla100_23290 [Neorhodopirellula pilleata]